MSVTKSSRDGAVATVTIDRPAEGNLLTIDMLRGSTRAVRAAAGDRRQGRRAAVERAPISAAAATPKAARRSPTALKMRVNVCKPILDVYDAMANAPQPIVCLVQGAAYGFGCGNGERRRHDDRGRQCALKLPEMLQNLPPTLAVSALMPRVPRKALTWMVYSMAELDARTALQVGIVSAVVAARRARSRPGELARDNDRALAGITRRGEGFLPGGALYGAARHGRLCRRSAGGGALVRREMSHGR